MVDAREKERAKDQWADRSLDLLVPQASPARNLVFFAVALFLLVGAWLSPRILRAEIRDLGSGSWTAFEASRQVLTTTRLDPSSGDVTIESVSDMPGAPVDGAWVLQYQTEMPEFAEELVPPLQPADPFDDIAARYPGQEVSSANELPQVIQSTPDDIELVILWTITDCSQLNEFASPSIVLKTAIGTTVQQPLDTFSGPTWDLSELAERGIC